MNIGIQWFKREIHQVHLQTLNKNAARLKTVKLISAVEMI